MNQVITSSYRSYEGMCLPVNHSGHVTGREVQNTVAMGRLRCVIAVIFSVFSIVQCLQRDRKYFLV